ncbi:MAG: flagellar basal body L-ring protein FlgH [Alphaproteobacteria bacterium]|nr:flagellar basal body L-ring protein FlgH [Alphaproteobacteria bacterium]
MKRIVLIMMTVSSLTACNTVDRLNEVGMAPKQSAIIDPTMSAGYQPVSMPMPTKTEFPQQANSLWTGEKQGFFKDQRAKTIGDIMTVVIDIDDKGKMENTSDRSRTTAETAGIPNLLGLEGSLNRILPESVDPANLVNGNSTSSYKGEGTTDRKEKIKMKLAATVTQVLPNGNMVIKGIQEVRVNYENRVLQLAGVVRPQDVNIDNTISYDQIAEARISYGGKGQITDVQQPRNGAQLLDILFPF